MAGEEFDEPDAGYMPMEEVDELDTGDTPKEEVHELDAGNIHGEDFNEHDAADMPQVSHPPQKQESRNDSGEGGGKRWPGWPGENVFRMLVPVQKVGSIIGRKGEFIKKITEETKARIKILDFPSGTERVVMVSAKEEPDAPVAPAIDGLLRVHKRLADVNSDPSHPPSAAGGVVITKLLVADAQAGSLIGKQGSTIKSIQDASNCNIRVLGAEHLPPFALQNDSVVEIHGEPASMHKAVELIASHLRKFLVDRSIVGVFEVQMQLPNAQSNQNMSSHQSWGPPPQAFPMNAAGGPGFVPNPQYMQPSHQFDNYHQPVDLLSLDKLPHQGSMYGRDPSIGVHASSAPLQQPIVKKVMHHMQIPLSYADAVIGPSGVNISYIRRASGATIAIQETKGIPGEMTVEINGSASQIQTAEQLIQNYVAEAAASSTQNPTVSQGYNTYPAQGPVYASPPSNTGHAGHAPAADYGPVYGSNYGY